MKFLTQNESRLRMNELSNHSTPFFFIISFDMTQNIIITAAELIKQNIFFKVEDFSDFDCNDEKIDKFDFYRIPIDFKIYSQAFDYVQTEITKGNSYLVNLTFPSIIKTEKSLLDIYKIGKAKYKLFFENQFVVFSPESFVKIENGIISTYPMKGTINANQPNAKEIILADKKEKAEHITIVDLLRNDLSLVAKNVKVEKFRYLDYIKTNVNEIIQVSSKITGVLPNNYKEKLGDIIYTLLPAGSISGAPKKKTLEIIKNAEIDNRGFYTGIFGWFDGSSLNSAVMIRFIEKANDNFIFRSGGGITYQSEKESEYNELIDKIYVPIH